MPVFAFGSCLKLYFSSASGHFVDHNYSLPKTNNSFRNHFRTSSMDDFYPLPSKFLPRVLPPPRPVFVGVNRPSSKYIDERRPFGRGPRYHRKRRHTMVKRLVTNQQQRTTSADDFRTTTQPKYVPRPIFVDVTAPLGPRPNLSGTNPLASQKSRVVGNKVLTQNHTSVRNLEPAQKLAPAQSRVLAQNQPSTTSSPQVRFGGAVTLSSSQTNSSKSTPPPAPAQSRVPAHNQPSTTSSTQVRFGGAVTLSSSQANSSKSTPPPAHAQTPSVSIIPHTASTSAKPSTSNVAISKPPRLMPKSANLVQNPLNLTKNLNVAHGQSPVGNAYIVNKKGAPLIHKPPTKIIKLPPPRQVNPPPLSRLTTTTTASPIVPQSSKSIVASPQINRIVASSAPQMNRAVASSATQTNRAVASCTPQTNRIIASSVPQTNRAVVSSTPQTNRAVASSAPQTNRAVASSTPQANRIVASSTSQTNRAVASASSQVNRAIAASSTAPVTASSTAPVTASGGTTESSSTESPTASQQSPLQKQIRGFMDHLHMLQQSMRNGNAVIPTTVTKDSNATTAPSTVNAPLSSLSLQTLVPNPVVPRTVIRMGRPRNLSPVIGGSRRDQPIIGLNAARNLSNLPKTYQRTKNNVAGGSNRVPTLTSSQNVIPPAQPQPTNRPVVRVIGAFPTTHVPAGYGTPPKITVPNNIASYPKVGTATNGPRITGKPNVGNGSRPLVVTPVGVVNRSGQRVVPGAGPVNGAAPRVVEQRSKKIVRSPIQKHNSPIQVDQLKQKLWANMNTSYRVAPNNLPKEPPRNSFNNNGKNVITRTYQNQTNKQSISPLRTSSLPSLSLSQPTISVSKSNKENRSRRKLSLKTNNNAGSTPTLVDLSNEEDGDSSGVSGSSLSQDMVSTLRKKGVSINYLGKGNETDVIRLD